MGCCGDRRKRKRSFQVDLLGRAVEPREGSMGSRLTDGGVDRPSAAGKRRRKRRRELPYGARPAVKERPLVDEGPRHEIGGDRRRWVHDRREHPGLPVQLFHDPRMDRFGGVGAPRAGALFRGRQIPALPASQDVCSLPSFDPSWGEPPPYVAGLPLEFDHARGAYRFDPQYILRRREVRSDPKAAQAYEAHARKWNEERVMLQPFKSPGSDKWRFRWISRIQGDGCDPASPKITRHPFMSGAHYH